MIDLKIDEFKPEYAGKMNFYLSAVDDLLRHPADAPTIGLILCKGRNEVIVEYALRDSAKPMGVAAYRVSSQLPKQLEGELPTPDELAREFPLMALVKLRIDIERTCASWRKSMVYPTARQLSGRCSSASRRSVACRRVSQTLAGRCAPWMRRRMARMFQRTPLPRPWTQARTSSTRSGGYWRIHERRR